jgi:hypothetical protein
VGGAAVVAKGALLYLCATMFVVYHATQEFYGFLTSSGISQGMPPPSRFVSVATTALCLSITVFTYFRCVASAAVHCLGGLKFWLADMAPRVRDTSAYTGCRLRCARHRQMPCQQHAVPPATIATATLSPAG